ncbi:MAG: DNA gyrase inhibitor YacG [Rhodospirillales bacterium]|nr:DNA gyrase inhibitor YacG [Rhodospirillales bacterium]
MCKRPVVAAHQPFCSPRCRDEDLRRWLVGDYRIPTDEPPPDGDPPAGGRE